METALDSEATEDVRQRRGVRTQSKHKHTDVTGEHECRQLADRETRQILKTIDNNHNYKPKPDRTRNVTICFD